MENRAVLTSDLVVNVHLYAQKHDIPMPLTTAEEDLRKNRYFWEALGGYCARRIAELIEQYEANFQRLMGEEWKKLAYKIQQKKQNIVNNFDTQLQYSDQNIPALSHKADSIANLLKFTPILEAHYDLIEVNAEIQNTKKQIADVMEEIKKLEEGVVEEVIERFEEFKRANKDSTLSLPTDKKVILETVNAIRSTSNPMEQIKHFGLLLRQEGTKEKNEVVHISNIAPSLVIKELESVLFFHMQLLAREEKIQSLTLKIIEINNTKLEPKNNQLMDQMEEYVEEYMHKKQETYSTPLTMKPAVSLKMDTAKVNPKVEDGDIINAVQPKAAPVA